MKKTGEKPNTAEVCEAKTRTAQITEALCKILAHNICVLMQSMFELNVKPEFWKEID